MSSNEWLYVRASQLVSAICVAFGGRGQVGVVDLGRAIVGHVNNAGLTQFSHTLDEIVRVVVEVFDADREDYTDSAAVLAACEEALAALQAVPARQPATY